MFLHEHSTSTLLHMDLLHVTFTLLTNVTISIVSRNVQHNGIEYTCAVHMSCSHCTPPYRWQRVIMHIEHFT